MHECFGWVLPVTCTGTPAGLVNTRLFEKVTFKYPFAFMTYMLGNIIGQTAAQVGRPRGGLKV